MKSVAVRRTVWVAGVVGLASLFYACGTKPTFGPDAGDVDASDANLVSDLGFHLNDASAGLVVTPANLTLAVTGSPLNQQYAAATQDTQTVVTGAAWSTDNAPLGSIDANGLFTAAGTIGGVTSINAEYNGAKGTTSLTINATVTENPGGVSSTDQTALKAGGTADSSFKFLYPYDKTVFPRGLGSPLLQFDGTAADKAYVHITSAHFTYDGFFSGSSPTQITFSPATWNAIEQSAGANDPVTVQVTKMSGGQVTGPVKQTWTIAQGSLHGTVYYSSYTSTLASGGATLKIKIGQQAQVLIAGCNTCHSVSGNGNVLAASYGHTYDATYDLTKDAGKVGQTADCTWCLPAVYPDGTMVLSSYGASIPGMGGTTMPALYDWKSGNTLSSTGISGLQASMPAFSPDGKRVTFNNEGAGAGHTLAVMNFDAKTRAFTSLSTVVTDTNLYPSWPAFTPDSASIVYHDDTGADYATWSGEKADLMIADVASKKTARLSSLDGMVGSGTSTYLPYGASETELNYEPTVLPVAVGGYYWVVFTSRRFYGNTMTPSNQPDPWSNTPRKKLWVAAIDINATPGTDSSHPAFYLPGQEFEAGNMRGFWVLDPCKSDGNTCETADECCGGYCRSTQNGKVCVPPPGGCSQEYEKCTSAGDCCNGGSLCVNGHCASPPPN